MRIHVTCTYCTAEIETGCADRLARLPKGARWYEHVWCNVCRQERLLDVGEAVHAALERDQGAGGRR
jgi:hypothetical protein